MRCVMWCGILILELCVEDVDTWRGWRIGPETQEGQKMIALILASYKEPLRSVKRKSDRFVLHTKG